MSFFLTIHVPISSSRRRRIFLSLISLRFFLISLSTFQDPTNQRTLVHAASIGSDVSVLCRLLVIPSHDVLSSGFSMCPASPSLLISSTSRESSGPNGHNSTHCCCMCRKVRRNPSRAGTARSRSSTSVSLSLSLSLPSLLSSFVLLTASDSH